MYFYLQVKKGVLIFLRLQSISSAIGRLQVQFQALAESGWLSAHMGR